MGKRRVSEEAWLDVDGDRTGFSGCPRCGSDFSINSHYGNSNSIYLINQKEIWKSVIK